jgi:ornithine carbamoyltransferase
MNCKIVTPKNYLPDDYFIKECEKLGGKTEITDKVDACTKNADVVATDTWISMGDESQKEKRINDFQGYTIDKKLMSYAKKDAVFLHCLPAYYGYEVTREVAYGPQSVIFDEAENRLWAQIAVMVTLLKK